MKENKIIVTMAVASLLIILALLFILWGVSKKVNKLKQIESLYSTSQSDLITERNKYNEEVAKTDVLTADKNKLLLQINSKDSSIIALQNVVKRYEKENGNLRTALVLSNETNLNLQDSIRNLIIGYSTIPETPGVKYPIYNRPITKEWYNGSITMGIDTLSLNLKIKNSYEVTIGDEKMSIFKRSLFANITNLNPDTETKVMKVYQKEPVKDHRIRNNSIAAGVGLLVGLIIK